MISCLSDAYDNPLLPLRASTMLYGGEVWRLSGMVRTGLRWWVWLCSKVEMRSWGKMQKSLACQLKRVQWLTQRRMRWGFWGWLWQVGSKMMSTSSYQGEADPEGRGDLCCYKIWRWIMRWAHYLKERQITEKKFNFYMVIKFYEWAICLPFSLKSLL